MKSIPALLAALALPVLVIAKPLPHQTKVVHKTKAGWWDAIARYPVFPAHSPVLNLANVDLAANARTAVAGFIADVPQYLIDNAKPDNALAFDSSFNISYASTSLLSLNLSTYMDFNGAHPNTVLATFNFGLVHGRAKKLALQDLFEPAVKASQEMNGLLMSTLRKKSLSFIQDGTVKNLSAQELNNFVLTPKGFEYMFSPYDVASYAEGPQFVNLSFGQVKGLDPNGPLKVFLQR